MTRPVFLTEIGWRILSSRPRGFCKFYFLRNFLLVHVLFSFDPFVVVFTIRLSRGLFNLSISILSSLSLSLSLSIYIYIYIYEVHTIIFQTFFVWRLLLIVHTWNFSPLRSNLHRLQCTSCTVPTTSGRPHGSPLVWACQWPSSQPLSSPQLSHNDSLWA